ncbi:ribonuclease, Rne/Rng family [Pseudooceanicola nitratireducens]|jgi:Ribonuclease G/E|uniref:Ribonuclease, Rne/Rng family n=1 Tax=Pseudooceanicola nitratireducens TaxID=517719 RepID=A0A1I1N1B1_9RHOB|nr:ribonuclease E/G [Pseudooceanicola nitratireducens]SEI76842.1 ribonuclease, Rne/Rng family [Pseudooceanicola nitratireducens]SFC91484.1 ribonuclease, Rne/Rng family [Pseudooceanicola nitratireducens]
MKGHLILLDHLTGPDGPVEAAALLRDGKLEDLHVDSDAPRPGAIYRASADRPVKGQGGMFLKTPDGPAFLKQVKGLSPGQPLLVQVTGHAEPGKAIPVTTRLLFKSRFAIVTPEAPGINVSRQIKDDDARDALLEIAHEVFAGHEMAARNAGLILRSSCDGADADAVADDIAAMADLALQVLNDAEGEPEKLTEGDGPHTLAWREWVMEAQIETEAGCFEHHGVHEKIAALFRPEVSLGTGAGSFAVEPTRAFVAVDVNTGGDTSLAAGLKANLAMARDLPRQLRLRGLGGVVVLDLAPMPKKDRRSFEGALRASLKTDDTDTVMAGWTPLGNYELQRKRARLPLSETVTESMLE